MKKIFFNLALVGVLIGTGIVGMSNSAFADTSIAQNDTLKNEEINLIKNGDFSDGGKDWLLNGTKPPLVQNGYVVQGYGYGPLFNAEPFAVEPNTKYKLEFDIKAESPITSQPYVELIGNGSTVQFSKALTSPDEWTTFSYEYTTPNYVNELTFSIFEQRSSYFALDNVKFVKLDK